MIDLLAYALYFAIVFFSIAYMLANKYKSIYYQKITYLNANLNHENLDSFKSKIKFKSSGNEVTYREPRLVDNFLQNPEYFSTVEDFKFKMKILKRTKIVLLSIIAFLVVIFSLNRTI